MRQKILEKMKVDLVEVKNWNGIKELEKKADLAIMAIGDEFYKARVYWKDRQPPAYKKMTSGVGHMMGDLLMATSSARCNGSSGDMAFFFLFQLLIHFDKFDSQNCQTLPSKNSNLPVLKLSN